MFSKYKPEMQLSENNILAIKKEFGSEGEAWIANYPTLLVSLLERWQLKIIGRAKGGLPINQVYFVEGPDRKPLVLKMGHPHPEQKTELIALKAYKQNHNNGQVAHLIDSVDGYGMLLDRLEPGTQLRDSIRDTEAITAALQLLKRLPGKNIPSGLPHFREWMQRAFEKYRASDNPDLLFLNFIETTERLYERYCQGEDCLLHGDLHHENILLNKGDWVAIDPKGVIGPAVLELGRFLHNFLGDEDSDDKTEILKRRIELAESVVDIDSETLVAVTYIDATLATTWTLNSGGDGAQGIAILYALEPLIKENS